MKATLRGSYDDMERNYWTRMQRQRLSRRSLLRASARAGVGAAGLALVGCGGDDDDGQQSAAQTQAQQQADQQAMQQQDQSAAEQQADQQAMQQQSAADAQDDRQDAQQAAAQQQAQQRTVAATGGVWKRGNTSTPNFIRIPLNTAGNNTAINQNGGLFNRLTRWSGPVGLQDDIGNMQRMVNPDFSPSPDLATSWEQPDNVTYIFNVREGVTYHSGRAFSAEDVAFTYEELKNPDVGGGGSPLHLMSANLDSAVATDATTAQLNFSQPTGYVYTLTSSTNIADRETLDQATEGVLIGTGAYSFENYDPNRGYDLVAFEDHWNGRPVIDKIEFSIFADNLAMAAALETGDIHSHYGVPIGNPEAEARLIESPDHYGRIHIGAGGRVLRFRADSPPFHDKRARQGVLLLVDGERITEEFAGTFDVAGRLPWQPGSPAFDAELDKPIYDPATARQLLDAAGLVDADATLRADVLPERVDAPAVAQLLQQELLQLGINMEVTNREYTEMITLQTTGTFDHMIIGFGNWVKPGDPSVTVLFADAYDGRMNAPVGEGVTPLRDREGIREELEWLDMIEAAKNGTFNEEYGDWRIFNERYLDVAWSNVLFRQYAGSWNTNNVEVDFDSEGWVYVESARV